MGAACLSWLQVQVHAGAYHGEVAMEEGLLWEEVTLRGGHGGRCWRRSLLWGRGKSGLCLSVGPACSSLWTPAVRMGT